MNPPRRATQQRTVINPWGVLAWALVVVVSFGGPAWVIEQWAALWQ